MLQSVKFVKLICDIKKHIDDEISTYPLLRACIQPPFSLLNELPLILLACPPEFKSKNHFNKNLK